MGNLDKNSENAGENVRKKEAQEPQEDKNKRVSSDYSDEDLELMDDDELKQKIKEEDEEFMKDYGDISIDGLIANGYVIHEVKISDKITARIRTLTSGEDRDLSKEFSNYEGNQNYVTAVHTDNILAKALVSFGDMEFATEGKAREFLNNQSVAIKTYLNQEHVKLLKALAILLKGPGAENPLIRPLTGIGSG